MLVLRHDERDENVDVEKADHTTLLAVYEPIDVFGGQRWSVWTAGKYRHAALETYVGFSKSSEQRFDERIDGLTRLACQIRKPLLQR